MKLDFSFGITRDKKDPATALTMAMNDFIDLKIKEVRKLNEQTFDGEDNFEKDVILLDAQILCELGDKWMTLVMTNDCNADQAQKLLTRISILRNLLPEEMHHDKDF